MPKKVTAGTKKSAFSMWVFLDLFSKEVVISYKAVVEYGKDFALL